jgi:hypothetical protein
MANNIMNVCCALISVCAGNRVMSLLLKMKRTTRRSRMRSLRGTRMIQMGMKGMKG